MRLPMQLRCPDYIPYSILELPQILLIEISVIHTTIVGQQVGDNTARHEHAGAKPAGQAHCVLDIIMPNKVLGNRNTNFPDGR